jgi:hypothetical protein
MRANFSYLLLLLFLFSSCNTLSREDELKEKGTVLIDSIESFKNKYHKLPESLEEIGIAQEEGIDAIYYIKKDSANYIVWFGMDLGESVIFYSDSMRWETINR